MTLYRATYLRAGFPRGVTFAADSVAEALEFSCFWERLARVEVLTLKPIPARVAGAFDPAAVTRPLGGQGSLRMIYADDEAAAEALRSVVA